MQTLTIGAAVGGLPIGSMLIQLISFIILLALLKKFAWKPLLKVMQDRQEYISNEIDMAEASRKEAEAATKTAAEELKQTRAEAQAIIEEARKAGQQQEENIIAAARRESERLKEAAVEDIAHEKEKAMQALQAQVASLSVQIASKIIEKEISSEDQDKLISEYVKELGR
ncbi:F0F1 ATP synthase subunit B [Terribacillus sp. DMT04]|uniref:F0F1 ATP synthase subunit B n=1 Tax=Terribacillus sp. DMT04 TaxID=2850441 RepID=UPI0020B89B8C|nr:F0F1 ATP synthase subunit B [Terribacillus sp. DMT04]